MVKEYILPEFDDMISEEELDALKKYVKDINNLVTSLDGVTIDFRFITKD